MKIAVCICTYKRPEHLASLIRLLVGFDYGDIQELTILVVDNAPPGAKAVCADIGDARIRYVPEPRHGRSFARETAVRTALRWNADFIAFLDDDDRPDPDWLKQLLAERGRTEAGIVYGTWRQDPSVSAPDWAKQTLRQFQAPISFGLTAPTGLSYHVGTGNVLIHAETFSRLSSPYFDPDFITGEDENFFLRARAAGVSMALAHKSIVTRGHVRRSTTLKLLKHGFEEGRGEAARYLKSFSLAFPAQAGGQPPPQLVKAFRNLAVLIFMIPVRLTFPYRFMHNIYLIFRQTGFILGYVKLRYKNRIAASEADPATARTTPPTLPDPVAGSDDPRA